MKRVRGWLLIAAGVLVAHAVVILLLLDRRVLPERRHVPPPNFSATEAVIDGDTPGEKLRIRQFTVSTRLAADEETVRRQRQVESIPRSTHDTPPPIHATPPQSSPPEPLRK